MVVSVKTWPSYQLLRTSAHCIYSYTKANQILGTY